MPPKRFVMRGMRQIDNNSVPTTPTLTRTFSSESSGGSYGGPSVRSRTVAGKSTRRGGVNAGLPYPIFEFGFPKPSEVVPIAEDSQFLPGPADDYMRSAAGAKLRADEGRYNAMLRQFVVRNTRLTGSSLLFLGSGSSRNMLRLLRMSPAKAVFVDVDEAALARLRVLISREGLDATTQIEYVLQDAYVWLLDNASAVLFDTVIATKCVGQILRGVGRTFTEFVDRVGGVCRFGGHFYVDHHVFAAQYPEGSRLGDDWYSREHRGMYDAATICGRYADDVCYTCETETPDFELVARFLSSEADRGVQVWELYCFRFTGRDASVQRPVIDFTSMPPAPTPFALPPAAGYDAVADSYLPANCKGVKRIPTAGDIRSYAVESCTPKIDGEPGLLIMDGPTAVFISNRHRFVRPLKNQLTINIAFSCELVQVQRSLALLVITGVVEQDATSCDPLDPLPMRHLEPLIDKFAQDGIIINSPRLMRYIVGDSVALPGVAVSRPIDLPIDGIQVLHSGRGGVFIKPSRLSTIDCKQSEAKGLIEGAYKSIGSFNLPQVYTDRTGDREAVYEFSRENGTHEWVPIKRRDDKQFSDTPGAIVHTIWALDAATSLGLVGTVEDIRPKIAR